MHRMLVRKVFFFLKRVSCHAAGLWSCSAPRKKDRPKNHFRGVLDISSSNVLPANASPQLPRADLAVRDDEATDRRLVAEAGAARGIYGFVDRICGGVAVYAAVERDGQRLVEGDVPSSADRARRRCWSNAHLAKRKHRLLW